MKVIILLAFLVTAGSFSLPGIHPVEYSPDDVLPIKVNAIKSTKTAIPFDYYSLMFCRPTIGGGIKADVENLGEILWGDVIKPSKYTVTVLKNQGCTKLCSTKPRPNPKDSKKAFHQLQKLKSRIDDEYRGQMLLDNLPVAEVYIWEGAKSSMYYKVGYPLGVPGNKTRSTLVNNHLAFTIHYHKPEALISSVVESGYRIVGFTVVPYSIDSAKIETECRPDNEDFRPELYPPQTVVFSPPEKATPQIYWSYSVTWKQSEVPWTSRWDVYVNSAESNNEKIHWFSILNSLLVVCFLSGMCAVIVNKAVHKDFNRYNDPKKGTADSDDTQEETGWKMVYADVFRTPPYHRYLCSYVGTGVQLISMGVITIIFALFGFLSPANRGALLTVMLLLFVLMGSYNGFITSRLAKMFHDQNWTVIAMSAFFFPGTCFALFFVNDLVLWAKQASNAVPFVTIIALMALWSCVCAPLVFVGAIFGYKREQIVPPIKPNSIQRAIPPQKWNPTLVSLLAGVIPFGAAFIELFFILSSLWLNKFYYVFGFLALVFIILAITCAEISIVMTYFQLCYEDWHWWWRSFMVSGSSGLYLFLYSICYFVSSLHIRNVYSILLYFMWMFVMSYAFTIMTGTIGFLASLLFVRHIYSRLKVD